MSEVMYVYLSQTGRAQSKLSPANENGEETEGKERDKRKFAFEEESLHLRYFTISDFVSLK